MTGNLQNCKVLYQQKIVHEREFVVFAKSLDWKTKNPKIELVNHILDADLFTKESNIQDIQDWKVANFNQFYETKIGLFKKFKEETW